MLSHLLRIYDAKEFSFVQFSNYLHADSVLQEITRSFTANKPNRINHSNHFLFPIQLFPEKRLTYSCTFFFSLKRTSRKKSATSTYIIVDDAKEPHIIHSDSPPNKIRSAEVKRVKNTCHSCLSIACKIYS